MPCKSDFNHLRERSVSNWVLQTRSAGVTLQNLHFWDRLVIRAPASYQGGWNPISPPLTDFLADGGKYLRPCRNWSGKCRSVSHLPADLPPHHTHSAVYPISASSVGREAPRMKDITESGPRETPPSSSFAPWKLKPQIAEVLLEFLSPLALPVPDTQQLQASWWITRLFQGLLQRVAVGSGGESQGGKWHKIWLCLVLYSPYTGL